MPPGRVKPLPRVLIVGEAGMLPSTARISFTALFWVSATNRFPVASTATAKGALKPLPRGVAVGVPVKVTCARAAAGSNKPAKTGRKRERRIRRNGSLGAGSETNVMMGDLVLLGKDSWGAWGWRGWLEDSNSPQESWGKVGDHLAAAR